MCCVLCIVCCSLIDARCVLLVAVRLLTFVGRCFCVTCCFLFACDLVVYCWLFIVGCWLFVVA